MEFLPATVALSGLELPCPFVYNCQALHLVAPALNPGLHRVKRTNWALQISTSGTADHAGLSKPDHTSDFIALPGPACLFERWCGSDHAHIY